MPDPESSQRSSLKVEDSGLLCPNQAGWEQSYLRARQPADGHVPVSHHPKAFPPLSWEKKNN